MNYLITLVGPTAIGKTALSIKLAQYFKCDIISCDSRQFFKEMTIGTAVPSQEELASAPHHFIQNKSIHESYSVGDFEKDALEILDTLFQKNKVQIMVGGSGLYVNAVLQGFDAFPEIDDSVRTSITTKYNELGLTYLQEQLEKLDPDYYNSIKKENPQTLQNPQRMKRFVEVCIGSGFPYSSFIGKAKQKRNFIPIIIGLEANRERMYARIDQRVDIMLDSGLIKEVENLVHYKELNALQTVGYKEIFDYLEGNSTLETAKENVKQNTRRFAKRQLTWFKRNDATAWFDFETNPSEIINSIEKQKIIVFSFLLFVFSCDIPYDLETRIIFETHLINSSGNTLEGIPYTITVENGNKYDQISTGFSTENGIVKSIFPQPDLTDYNIGLVISKTGYLPLQIVNFSKKNTIDYKITYPEAILYKSEEVVTLTITLVNTNPNKQIRKIDFQGNKYEERIEVNPVINNDYYDTETIFKVLKNQNSQIKYSVYNYTTATLEENTLAVTIVNTDENITITY